MYDNLISPGRFIWTVWTTRKMFLWCPHHVSDSRIYNSELRKLLAPT